MKTARVLGLGVIALATTRFCLCETAAPQEVRIFDTMVTSPTVLASDAVSRPSGWRPITAGQLEHDWKGDVCAVNNHIALVLRRSAQGAECYYRLGSQMVKGPTLIPTSRNAGKANSAHMFKLIENMPQRVTIEATATLASGGKLTTRYTLKMGVPIVETQAGDETCALLVEAPARHVVLPDPFAGDLVLSAADAQTPQVRFPSEHMLLQLQEDRNAIVMPVWLSSQQRVRLHIGGSGDAKTIHVAEVTYPQAHQPAVWVAVLAAPNIWHEQRQGELHPVKDAKLDWKVPFRAQWRADLRRTDGLTDSWKCPIRNAKGEFEGVGFSLKKARTVWTSARGTFAYPPCIEGDTCYLRKTKFEPWPEIQYDDNRSALLYPFCRLDGSPAGALGVLNALDAALQGTSKASLRNALRIQSVERDKWPPTCTVTGEYEKIFDAGQEKTKKTFLLGRLEEMNNFVIGIRSRMNEFLDWGRKTRAWLAKTKAEKPQLAALADEFENHIAQFAKVYERRKLDERTPAAARVLIDKVIQLIDSNEDREKKLERIKQLGRETRTIGGNQDSAIGEFRMFTKQLRQRAGIRMTEAQDDAAFEFAREMRQRTMEVLQCAFGHESAEAD